MQKKRRTKLLTDEQIVEGKALKEQGFSKRRLAEIFGIGQTTVWENIFATEQRVRLYKKREYRKKVCVPCTKCEICMTTTIFNNQIPMNLQVGDTCISCYMKEKGINFMDII